MPPQPPRVSPALPRRGRTELDADLVSRARLLLLLAPALLDVALEPQLVLLPLGLTRGASTHRIGRAVVCRLVMWPDARPGLARQMTTYPRRGNYSASCNAPTRVAAPVLPRPRASARAWPERRASCYGETSEPLAAVWARACSSSRPARTRSASRSFSRSRSSFCAAPALFHEHRVHLLCVKDSRRSCANGRLQTHEPRRCKLTLSQATRSKVCAWARGM